MYEEYLHLERIWNQHWSPDGEIKHVELLELRFKLRLPCNILNDACRHLRRRGRWGGGNYAYKCDGFLHKLRGLSWFFVDAKANLNYARIWDLVWERTWLYFVSGKNPVIKDVRLSRRLLSVSLLKLFLIKPNRFPQQASLSSCLLMSKVK